MEEGWPHGSATYSDSGYLQLCGSESTRIVVHTPHSPTSLSKQGASDQTCCPIDTRGVRTAGDVDSVYRFCHLNIMLIECIHQNKYVDVGPPYCQPKCRLAERYAAPW